jgi:holo-[acyl-carrier protein] synthase|tara:strand:- start:4778 stop:5110 length:333 start_codon:yes stop_codon:yes gene_type:complete
MRGIGVDIEEISRFSKHEYKNKKKLYEKIFSIDEINYCLNKHDPYPHFTARFCAKEAVIKAIGNKKINLKDIEVVLVDSKPIIKSSHVKTCFVSLSHTKTHAIAFVIVID